MDKVNFIGTYETINALWKRYPEGGKEGDWATVDGKSLYWDKYSSSWISIIDNSIHQENTGDVTIDNIEANYLGTFESINALWKRYPEGGKEGDWATVDGKKYWWNKYARIWDNNRDSGSVDDGGHGSDVSFNGKELHDLGIFLSLDVLWKRYPEGGKEGDWATVDGKKYWWNKYTKRWTDNPLSTSGKVMVSEIPAGDVSYKLQELTNLGEFNTIEEVWDKYPAGGKSGEYAKIGGVKYWWNPYTEKWQDADSIIPEVPRHTTTVDGNVIVNCDASVDNNLNVHHDARINNDLMVGGVARLNNDLVVKGCIQSKNADIKEYEENFVNIRSAIISLTESVKRALNLSSSSSEHTKLSDYAAQAGVAEKATDLTDEGWIKSDLHNVSRFLSKLSPDTAQELITFLKGIAFKDKYGISGLGEAVLKSLKLDGAEIDEEGRATVKSLTAEAVKSPDFKDSGTNLDGKGFGMWVDSFGRSHAVADIIEARVKAVFAELEVKKFTFSSGDQGFTRAGCRIALVKRLPSGDFRCYWLADDGERRISNDFHVGDQAMAKTSNIISKTTQMAENRYYWRLVVNTGEETLEDGKLYNFVDLSDTRGTVTLTVGGKDHTCIGCDTSVPNDEPKAEDSIVQLGSQTDPERRYAYIIYVSTGERVTYAGINDYDLDSHIVELRSAKRNFTVSGYHEIISASGTGEGSPLVCERGAWYNGAVSGHYDHWSHNNATWLCIVGKGRTTTTEPKDGSPEWVKETYGQKGETPLLLAILTDRGNIIRNGQGQVVLTAVVTRGGEDITSTFQDRDFSWTRNSGNEEYDKEWDNRHKGVGHVITVRAEDIWKRAQFDCILNDI